MDSIKRNQFLSPGFGKTAVININEIITDEKRFDLLIISYSFQLRNKKSRNLSIMTALRLVFK